MEVRQIELENDFFFSTVRKQNSFGGKEMVEKHLFAQSTRFIFSLLLCILFLNEHYLTNAHITPAATKADLVVSPFSALNMDHFNRSGIFA